MFFRKKSGYQKDDRNVDLEMSDVGGLSAENIIKHESVDGWSADGSAVVGDTHTSGEDGERGAEQNTYGTLLGLSRLCSCHIRIVSKKVHFRKPNSSLKSCEECRRHQESWKHHLKIAITSRLSARRAHF